MPVDISSVRDAINYIKEYVDSRNYFIRESDLIDRCLLGLLSKSSSTCMAVCTLVEANFPDEALGLSRTVLDVFITVRYICNRDTAARAKSFLRFISAHIKNVETTRKNHSLRPLDPLTQSSDESQARSTLLTMAEEFTRTKGWRPVSKMAREEGDCANIDVGFHYDGIYELQSHHVHATAVSLARFDLRGGKPFRLGRRLDDSNVNGIYAAFCALTYLTSILEITENSLGQSAPPALFERLSEVLNALKGQLPPQRLTRLPR